MANTVIRLKKSSVPGELPSSLEHGELALNYADGKLYYKDQSNSIQQISSGNSFATINAAGTVIIADLQNDVLSFQAGENIEITGDYINDAITITANLKSVFDQANAAYARANSSNDVLYVAAAYNTANLGFDVANAAFAAANNVAPQIAPVYNLTNAAFGVANAAYELASNVAPQVKPAFDTANAAFDKANNASANVGSSAPVGSNPGSLWWDTNLGRLFIYYNDGDSSQWVETSPSGGVVNLSSLAANVAPYFMYGSNTANAAYVVANAAYDTANAALPNTSNAVFNGDLNILGLVKVGQSEIRSISHLTGSPGPEVIDSFEMNRWRSAQYTITMTAGVEFGTSQISVLHDDTFAYMTEYGILTSNNSMGTFDVTVMGSNVNLRITPTDSVTSIKILRTTNK